MTTVRRDDERRKRMKYLVIVALLLSAPTMAKEEVIIKKGEEYHVITTNCQVNRKEVVRFAKVSRLKERAPIELITNKNKLTCEVKEVRKLT